VYFQFIHREAQVQQSPLVRLLAQNLPARQVLCTQELAGLIVDSLDGEDRKALVALTTLNPSFFNASTDAIWRSVPSLSPFLRLLPELYSGADNYINVRNLDVLSSSPKILIIYMTLIDVFSQKRGPDSVFTAQKL
jgi:hypothetical protein